jgi:hypothetical protein
MVRVLLVPATVALLAVGAGGAAPSTGSRVLWQGPVLGGESLVWSEAGASGSVHRWTAGSGERVVYRSDSLALSRPIAASRTLLAFGRSYPGCEPQPNVACPQVEDALVGPPGGSYRTLVHPHTCVLATAGATLTLDRGVAAYIEPDCRRNHVQVVVRDLGHGTRPLVVRQAAASQECCRDVALAGRFVAWNEGRGDVVVYDRLAHRTAYRAHAAPNGGIGVELGFDLQDDGKLAVAYRPIEVARTVPATVVWFSRAAAKAHALPFRARDTRVRIAGDRIVYERFPNANTSALAVVDLAGHARTIARFAPPLRPGEFDYDGRRVAWSADRVTATRVDCPPPGQGRPCVMRETGVTTIRVRAVDAARSRVVARLPFDDVFAR